MAGKAIIKFWEWASENTVSEHMTKATCYHWICLLKKLDFFLFRSYLINTDVYGTHEVTNFICDFTVNFTKRNYFVWQQSMLEWQKYIPEGGAYSLI